MEIINCCILTSTCTLVQIIFYLSFSHIAAVDDKTSDETLISADVFFAAAKIVPRR